MTALEEKQAKARNEIIRNWPTQTTNPLNNRQVTKNDIVNNDGAADAWNAHMVQMTNAMGQSDAVIASQWVEPEATVSIKK